MNLTELNSLLGDIITFAKPGEMFMKQENQYEKFMRALHPELKDIIFPPMHPAVKAALKKDTMAYAKHIGADVSSLKGIVGAQVHMLKARKLFADILKKRKILMMPMG